MAEVTLDCNDLEKFGEISQKSDSFVHLSQRMDAPTIEKMKEISIPTPIYAEGELKSRIAVAEPTLVKNSDENKSLLERLSNFIGGILGLEQPVSENEPLQDAITHELMQLEPEEFEELEQKMIESPDRGANYLIRLQNLIAAILGQLQQISEKDKEKINQLEKEYKKDTLSAANLQRELGWSGLKFAALCFVTSFLQFQTLNPYESDRAIAKIFGEQVLPKFGEMWNSDLNARLTSKTNSGQLTMAKYNMLVQGEQGKTNDKQQVSNTFDKALQIRTAASRTGG